MAKSVEEDTAKMEDSKNVVPKSVAVIGCGPGGLGFCHAIESMRRRHGDNGIEVVCFEQSERPGGVWKAADTKDSVNMYDALWTNGASHAIEFSDYTFDEHFGRPVTVYLTRAEVLGYLIGRVTKNCPDFFEKYVQFGTRVANVIFVENSEQFLVTTTCVKTGCFATKSFDKVVWACGDNGKPFIPSSQRQIFASYRGRFIHSSETANFEQDVRGKRILLIGGGYSAEDLALQAIKIGVEKVYIVSRDDDACGIHAKAWPYNKVRVITEQGIVGVDSESQKILLSPVEWDIDEGYYFPDESEISWELKDIHTVICCTGYKHNFDMLDESLRLGKEEVQLEVPADWSLPEGDDSATFSGGVAVAPDTKTFYYADSTRADLYRGGVLIRNPNMMFVWTYDGDFPLLAADVSAWLLASYVYGTTPLPTKEQMKFNTLQDALHELKFPFYRYYMDRAFNAALASYEDENEDCEAFAKAWENWHTDASIYQVKLLARHMQDGGYPYNLGDFDELNENGRGLLSLDDLSEDHRLELTPSVIKKYPWKTFRDYSNAASFQSLHTGTAAVALSARWLDGGVDETVMARGRQEEKKNCA